MGGAGAPALAAPGARIGTSSERRRAQLLAVRPDLEVASVRGNLETRLRKLDEGQYDALIVTAAGLVRLGLLERVTSFLEAPAWLPAAGQGALAVESRADGAVTDGLLVAIEDPVARAETDAERALLATLQGGCQVPVGARARAEGEELVLHALVAAADGTQLVRAEGRGRRERAVEFGIEVAHDLLSRGGEAIVAAFRTPKR